MKMFMGMNIGLGNNEQKKNFSASEHPAEDIVRVSVSSSGGTELAQNRSFVLEKTDGAWLLTAGFYLLYERVEFEGCPVTDEEAAGVIALVKETDAIREIASYKPMKSDVFAVDAPSYYSGLYFSDGEKIGAGIYFQVIESYLLELSEKYAERYRTTPAEE